MSFAQFILNKAAKSAQDAEVMRRRAAECRTEKPTRTPARRGPRRIWTDEKDELITRLAKDLTTMQIAERTGQSYHSIKGRLHRLRVKSKAEYRPSYRRWTPAMFEQVKIMYRAGKTSIEIAKVMGMNENQVRGTIQRLGITGKRRRWTFAEELAVARWFNHKNNDVLLAALGREESKAQSKYTRLAASGRLKRLREMVDEPCIVFEYCKAHNLPLPEARPDRRRKETIKGEKA